MTDEERQKLVSKLLEIVHGTDFRDMWIRPYVKEAAEEIERLAKEVKNAKQTAFHEAAEIADSFGDRHEEYEVGDAIRSRVADRSGK